MTGRSGSNSPGGSPPTDNVRHLQRQLWVAAKRSPGRRFHALLNRIWRADILREAWRRVKRNRGSAGLDRARLAAIEQCGVEPFLTDLGSALRDGTYRPLGIPTVRDRTAQMAATRFIQLDRYVADRPPGLLLKRHGSRHTAGPAAAWRRPLFEAMGLCRLRGTVQYPGAA